MAKTMANDETDNPDDEKKNDSDAPKAEGDQDKVDDAVSDIVKQESDEVLEAEDSHFKPTVSDFHPWYEKKRFWIPAIIILIVATILAIPKSRYATLSLVWKQNYQVQVLDSQTGLPVSDAMVSLDGRTAETNNQGKASLHVKIGSADLTISKKYYSSYIESQLVPFRVHGAIVFKLVASGRQVPITVTNKINGTPISDALVAAAGTDAKTNAKGMVTIVLPADSSTVKATINANGYNALNTTITVSAAALPANSLQLVPVGSAYFLSNASGTVDIDSANLDGSNVQAVVKGTGTEDPNNTQILASYDWKYVALIAQRGSTNQALYILDTNDNQLSKVDSTASGYTFDGWTSSDYLVYTTFNSNIAAGQPGTEALKSYDAPSGKLTTIDQANGAADNTITSNEVYDSVNVLSDGSIVYLKTWSGNTELSGLSDTVNSVQPNGGDKTTLLSVNANGYFSYDQAVAAGPSSVYYYLLQTNGGAVVYYEYQDGKVQQITGSAATAAQQAQSNFTTYYVSPSGQQTLWNSLVNGHSAVMVGDGNAGSPKQVALLDNTYNVYGWYGNNYILISKNNNELYIMPTSGVSNSNQLVKISNYL